MSQLVENLTGFDRLPPHSIESEMCLLASMMLDHSCFVDVLQIVNRDSFFQADNQVIFDMLVMMESKGKAIDSMTLRAELEKRQLLEEVGGVAYLAAILNTVPASAHALHYARILREKEVLRKLIAFGNEVLRDAYGPQESADDVVTKAVNRLGSLAIDRRKCTFQPVQELLAETIEQLNKGGVPMVPTGIKALDEKTGGIGIGEMAIVAARPSMGKSTLLRQMVRSAALGGIPVGFISLEESSVKIMRNMLSSECGIENQKLRKANLGEHEWNSIVGCTATYADVTMLVTDKTRSMRDIRALVNVWSSKYGVKLIILDYLQRVRGVGGEKAYETVSRISGDLSDLWKECGVAAIVAAQLNRGVEGREDKRPNMSDLRDSGAIEQDADGIVLLHREDYYHFNDPNYERNHTAELIIAKWRDGARGYTIKLKSDLRYQRFDDLPLDQQYKNNPFA